MMIFTILPLLLHSLISAFQHFSPPNAGIAIQQSTEIQKNPKDTLVNYCKLIHAAYFYGQQDADRKLGLTAQDTATFNGLWRQVFNVPALQVGITPREFKYGARFGEGSRASFPSSTTYLKTNSDPYYLFQTVRQMGMIHSEYFAKCPDCVKLSIAKINAYFKVLPLRKQIPQIWVDGDETRKLNDIADIDEFWQYLTCLYGDVQINPMNEEPFGNMHVVPCRDTIRIFETTSLKASRTSIIQNCEVEATIDASDPILIKGTDGKPGAVYQVLYVARNTCNISDTCTQYYLLEKR